jgi:hypothetical protein
MMQRAGALRRVRALGFLWTWYYQSLDHADGR